MRIEPDTPIEGWRGGLLASWDRNQWWHVSLKGNAAKFREMEPGSEVRKFRRDTDENSFRSFTNGKIYLSWSVLSDVLDGLPDRPPTFEMREQWRAIIQIAKKVAIDEFERAENPQKTVVPTTALRCFYRVLTEMTCATIRRSFARYLAENPKKTLELDSLVAQSVAHIRGCGYDNRRDSLIATREGEDDFAGSDNEHPSANTFVANAMRHGGINVLGCPDLNAEYIGREVAPLRTTNGRYESGEAASNSGDGGIDLLLRSKDGRPIVAELKASTDVGPLIGLIQALTYSTEMSVESQLARRVYEDDREPRFTADDSLVDIYLMFEGEGDSEEWRNVEEIAKGLFAPDRNTPNHVRRIAALKWDNQTYSGSRPEVAMHFCVPARG